MENIFTYPKRLIGWGIECGKVWLRNKEREKMELLERHQNAIAESARASYVGMRQSPDTPAPALNKPISKPQFSQVIGNINNGDLLVDIGVDNNGNSVIIPINKCPHLLIAGTTGSGKSVAIHSIIFQLIKKYGASELGLLLADPKGAEFPFFYQNAPQLLKPVAVDPVDVIGILEFAISEMDRRNAILQDSGCRNIERFNQKNPQNKIKRIVVVIDEFADLMLQTDGDFETLVKRLAAKSRSAGIHLILCTQRPDAKIVTGAIKANIPSIICLKVASAINSRIILDRAGGELLRGKGHMICRIDGGADVECQAHYLSDDTLERLAAQLAAAKRDTARA